MVRLYENNLAALQTLLDRSRDVPYVRHVREDDSSAAKPKGYWFSCIVGSRENFHDESAELQALVRFEPQPVDLAVEVLSQGSKRSLGRIDGYAMLASKPWGSFHVILVFVRQQDRVDGAGQNAYGGQTPLELSTGQTGIDEDVLRTVRDKRDIAGASAGKD